MTDHYDGVQKANKVFLTSRTHYFFDEIQERKIISSSYTILYKNYATKTNYEITRIKLKKFSDEQIKEYIFKNTKNESLAAGIVKIIKDTYNLEELSTRPILLDMIIKTLPSLVNRRTINASNLYKAYTALWIERDDWRAKMTPDGKRRFMWELAFKVFKNGGDFSLHYSALNKPLRAYLKDAMKYTDGKDDYYRYETTTCTFLNRDSDGNYRFIHKSFMEYFLAEHYYYRIKRKKKEDSRVLF